ncbi:MAG: radical SAM protein, partial [Planctomycetes bacterium]|nr:radical SAM protein [Planctomycetota bacterium]
MRSPRPVLRRVKAALKRATYAILPDALLARVVSWKMPRSAQVEVTTHCNLRCPLCVTHDVERGPRPLDERVIDGLHAACGSRLKNVALHLLGEPLVHPRLFDMVRAAAAHGVATSFSTNGMLLGKHVDDVLDSGLSFLSVAIDGVDQRSYSAYRWGGDLDVVVANVRALLAERARRGRRLPVVQVQMVMFPYNEDDEERALAFLRGLGADVVSLKRPSYDAPDKPAARAFLRDVDAGGTGRRWARLSLPTEALFRNRPMCPQLERATILSDGRAVACCLDPLGETAYGNVHDTPFARLWRGDARRALVRRFLRRELDICQRCTL